MRKMNSVSSRPTRKCHSFLVNIFTKSLHRGGVYSPQLFRYSDQHVFWNLIENKSDKNSKMKSHKRYMIWKFWPQWPWKQPLNLSSLKIRPADLILNYIFKISGFRWSKWAIDSRNLGPSQLPSLFRPYCDVPLSPSLEVESGNVLGGSKFTHTYKCAYIDGGQKQQLSPSRSSNARDF